MKKLFPPQPKVLPDNFKIIKQNKNTLYAKKKEVKIFSYHRKESKTRSERDNVGNLDGERVKT